MVAAIGDPRDALPEARIEIVEEERGSRADDRPVEPFGFELLDLGVGLVEAGTGALQDTSCRGVAVAARAAFPQTAAPRTIWTDQPSRPG